MRTHLILAIALLATLANPTHAQELMTDPGPVETPLAESLFRPMLKLGLISRYLPGAEPIILPGGVERFDNIRMAGADWMFSGTAMQLEPANGLPELYIEGPELILPSGRMARMDVLAAFPQPDMLTSLKGQPPAATLLLAAQPAAFETACRLISSEISAMAENATYHEEGRRTGGITGLTASLSFDDSSEPCRFQAGLYIGEVSAREASGRETYIELATIEAGGAAGNPAGRHISLDLTGLTRTRDGVQTGPEDISVELQGAQAEAAIAALARIAKSDINGVQDLADLAVDAKP